MMLQMIRSSHLGTCCCKQTVHSTHTHTHPYPTCTGAADIQRCCCSSVHYSLSFFLPSLFLFFFFQKNAMTFVMVCVGCPLSSTVLLHGVLDSSCVCLLAYNVEAGVHFTSLPSLMVFKFFLSFHHIPTECWTAAPPACFALNAQVCNTHARTYTRTQHTARAHTQHTYLSLTHISFSFTSSPPPHPPLAPRLFNF